MRPTLALLASCLVLSASLTLAIRLGGEDPLARKLVESNPTAPNGWWQSISIAVGSKQVYCALRDFPPIPDGYGKSRMQCGGSTTNYDPQFLWILTKASGTSPISSGDSVYLRIFNPMLTWCNTAGNGQIFCGVAQSAATPFTVQKVGTGSSIDFQTDSVYLKSGNMFCSLPASAKWNKGESQFIYCNQPTVATATVFNMPYTHFYNVSLTSTLNSNACGGNFIPLKGDWSEVNCTTGNAIPSNYFTNWIFSSKTTGPKFLASGTPYSVTAHQELYHYQVSAWSTLANGAVAAISNDTKEPGIWFTFEAAGAAPGTALVSGKPVAIKSVVTGKYCCLSSSTAQLTCNQPYSTGAGCQFTIAF